MKSRGGLGSLTNVNVPGITCSHITGRAKNSSPGHHLNDLSFTERLKEISVFEHSRTAGKKHLPRVKLNLMAICTYKKKIRGFKMSFAGKSRWDAVLSPLAAQTIIGDNCREAAFPLRSQTERITGHLEQCVSLSLNVLMGKKSFRSFQLLPNCTLLKSGSFS